MTDENMIEVLRKKVNSFHKANLPVHIPLKKNWFYNGYILEESFDFFIIDDFKEGRMAVFYIEIIDVELFKRDGEK